MIRAIRNGLLVGLIGLVLVALAAPIVVGFYLEREHQRLIGNISLPGMWRLAPAGFDRGLFRSDLRLRLVAADCVAPGCDGPVLDLTIHHGPVPFTAPAASGARLQPAAGVITGQLPVTVLLDARRLQPTPPPLTLYARAGLDGDTDLRAALPALSLRVPDGDGAARLETDAFEATGAITGPDRALTLRATLPRFSLVAERGGQIGFRDLVAEISAGRDPDGRPAGYRLQLEDLQLATPGGDGAALEGLRLAAHAQAGGENFDLRISRIAARGEDYGPVLAEGRLTTTDGPTRLPELAARVTLAPAPWARLVRAGPTLTLDRLLLGAPDGDIRLEGEIGARPDAEPAQALQGDMRLQLPVATMRNITAAVMRHRHPDQPPPTPERVEGAINEWLARGFIAYTEPDHAYVIHAALDGDDIRVNQRTLENWQVLIDELDMPEPAPAR
ncbi:DUF945 family protein [Spectribacter hydrogenooxidans]|uniref:DUF945 family protein n=1 Tax=Spectribacter hydrogenoxidans TaxID=3075608 RepID=A0ABU3BVZ1_9GAMM|nr:DUF945 family protein [Salinisphaera sp. W335]MDT0633458.1 DUF945 family protein [Salinisphaera sp. W335]